MKYLLLLLIVIAAVVATPVSSSPAWRDFHDVDQLTEWAEEHTRITLLWGDGLPTTCVDYSLNFQREAYLDGYRVSVAYTWDGYLCQGIKVTNTMGVHWGAMAMAGASVYYIDTAPGKFKITRVGPIQSRRM